MSRLHDHKTGKVKEAQRIKEQKLSEKENQAIYDALFHTKHEE